MSQIPEAKEDKETRREKEWREEIEKSSVCEFRGEQDILTGDAPCTHPDSVVEICMPCCFEARQELRTFKLTLVKQFQRNRRLRKENEKLKKK